jgi:putative transposase
VTSETWATAELQSGRMPWLMTNPMDERVKFIAAYLRGELSLSRLCETFGVSRKTAYKWISRYADGGVAELLERSRRPLSNPRSTSREVVSLIVAMRKQYAFWGPKKLLTMLGTAYPGLKLPANSTVGHLLARHGMTHPRRSSRRTAPYGQPFLGYDKPNAVWCGDYKGHFRLLDRTRCHPLTISDGFSRYVLRCEGLRHPRHDPTRDVFEQAFREFGLPDAIRTDNGAPFASTTLGGLSKLSVWWIRLGIRPERIEPGRPDQNGRHERMHRTLKAEATKPMHLDLATQQARFDEWRKEFNEVRPHEALGMKTPASYYEPSPRLYPAELPELVYPPNFETRRVNQSGYILFERHKVYLGWCLPKQVVGLEELEGDKWIVHFGPHALAVVDAASGKLNPLPSPSTRIRKKHQANAKPEEEPNEPR